MGSGASSSPKVSPDELPKQLFVEGAGSARANGKFIRRSGKRSGNSQTKSSLSRKSPLSRTLSRSLTKAVCDWSTWFCKEDDEDCWMGFVDARKSDGVGDSDERKWVICTDQEILYMAPITDEEIAPRQGRWELGGDGASPTPTVNLEPLPAPFRLSGWKSHHDRLNGEYLPLDDGSKQLNHRPIFQHVPVVGVLAHQDVLGNQDKRRLYWYHGAWCIGNEEQLQSCIASSSSPASSSNSLLKAKGLKALQKTFDARKHTPCTAFVESDATHPSAMSAEVVWKATASEFDSGTHEDEFEVVEDVSLTKGMVRAPYVTAPVAVPPALSASLFHPLTWLQRVCEVLVFQPKI